MKVKSFILSSLLLLTAVGSSAADDIESALLSEEPGTAIGAEFSLSPDFTLNKEILATEKESGTPEDLIEYILPKNANRGLLNGGNLATGLALVTVHSADVKGRFFKSLELTLKFGDDGQCGKKTKDKDGKEAVHKFHCVKQDYSTQSENLFYALRDLDPEQAIIIKYKKQLLPNPFTRATRYNITDFYPSYIGTDPRKAGIREFFKEGNDVANSHLPAKIQGRIIDVKRWGRAKTGCVLTLQLPGSRTEDRMFTTDHLEPNIGIGLDFGPGRLPLIPRGAKPNVGMSLRKKSVSVLNYAKIKLASSEACRYAEDLIPFVHPVEVRYSQAYSEFFDYSRAAESIHLL